MNWPLILIWVEAFLLPAALLCVHAAYMAMTFWIDRRCGREEGSTLTRLGGAGFAAALAGGFAGWAGVPGWTYLLGWGIAFAAAAQAAPLWLIYAAVGRGVRRAVRRPIEP
ncbi:hypothetical protein [Alienimonas sp. DA493]|uniref:hypothetical protein n=1 Tax=Alienimonas sp. DA493 TaxID=3373605 RepID=UPI0037550FD0